MSEIVDPYIALIILYIIQLLFWLVMSNQNAFTKKAYEIIYLIPMSLYFFIVVMAIENIRTNKS